MVEQLLKHFIGRKPQHVELSNFITGQCFMTVVEAHWTAKVSTVMNHQKKLRALNKPIVTPATVNWITLKAFLERELEAVTQYSNHSYEEWKVVAQMVMVRVVLVNKRRISEVDELLLLDFNSRSSSNQNQEIVDSLDATEQALVKR